MRLAELPDGFDSGAYEQAARVFRQHGYNSQAEQILIAQRKHARQVTRSTARWPRRAMDATYATIGYSMPCSAGSSRPTPKAE